MFSIIYCIFSYLIIKTLEAFEFLSVALALTYDILIYYFKGLLILNTLYFKFDFHLDL